MNEQIKNNEAETPVLPIEKEKKREIISVQVTPEEKRKINIMALKDCGISVSEFVRTKIFLEPKKNSIEAPTENPISDEEREMFKETLNSKNEEIKPLKDEKVKIKVANVKERQNEAQNNELTELEKSALIIVLNEKYMAIFNRIKSYRKEALEKMNDKDKAVFFDFNKYLITLLLRGLRRSYYNAQLASNSGLNTGNIAEIAAAELIDYEEEV